MDREMRKLYGITYAQLVNFTTEELNDILQAHMVNEVRKNFKANGIPSDQGEKILSVLMKHGSKLYNDVMTDKTYEAMRKIYDTEDRFNLSVDIQDATGNIPQRLNELMQDIIDELKE